MLEGFKKISIMSGSSFVSVTSNGLNFNGNVVFHMQKAKRIILLINAETKQIAIQKSDESDTDSIPFLRDGTNWKNGVRFNNREIQQMIAKMMDWNLEQYNYRADGFYIDKEQAMIFDLNKARKFSKRNQKHSNESKN